MAPLGRAVSSRGSIEGYGKYDVFLNKKTVYNKVYNFLYNNKKINFSVAPFTVDLVTLCGSRYDLCSHVFIPAKPTRSRIVSLPIIFY